MSNKRFTNRAPTSQARTRKNSAGQKSASSAGSNDDTQSRKTAPLLGEPQPATLEWQHPAASHADTSAPALEISRIASKDELHRLAQALRVVSVTKFTAQYELQPLSQGRLRLSGNLQSQLVQTCVTSLEPLDATVNEDFEVEFRPLKQIKRQAAEDADLTLEDLDGPDIEPILDGMIDAGRIVYEVLATSIVPYPRAPGVPFVEQQATGGTVIASNSPTTTSAFAKLAAIKQKH